MDNFDVATEATRILSHALLASEIPSVIVADALLTQALSVWAAETGRAPAAREFLRVWTETRDGK
jgi:hypothetical protein